MRLLIACEHLTPTRIEDDAVIALAGQLSARGHRVSLVGGVIEHNTLAGGVAVSSFTDTPRFFEWKLAAFLRWQAQQRAAIAPDAVVSFSPILAGDVVVPLRGLALAHGLAVGTWLPGPRRRLVEQVLACLPGRQNRTRLQQQNLADPGIRAWLALSPIIARELREADPEHTAQVRPVVLPLPDSTPADRSEAMPDTMPPLNGRQRLARAWGVPADVAWFVFAFDACAKASGFEALLQAFGSFIDRGGEAVLLLTGRWRYAHLKRIAAAGLRDRVVFVGPLEQHARLYALADLFLSLADHDPGGWGVRLALGLGRSVVTTSGCGASEQARERGGAVLDTPIDPQQLAEVMAEQNRVSLATGGSPHAATTPAARHPLSGLADELENLLRDA